MRWGLIARADARGLAHMTWEAHRHLHPDRTLIVDMGLLSRGFPLHREWYGPDDVVVAFDELGSSPEVDRFLDGLDVVYSAETFYNDRFLVRARELGVRTVMHVMPEFFNHDAMRADVLWVPTPWLVDRLPRGVRDVAVPVPVDRWPAPSFADPGRLRLVHVAGTRAAADRNGTVAFLTALRFVTAEVEVMMLTQRSVLPAPRMPRNVRYARRMNGERDYWAMYLGHHALVMPRRYGGLCLPVQEAAGAGLAVVMTDVSPNDVYPARLVGVEREVTKMATAIGDLDVAVPSSRSLAALIDAWAAHPDVLADDRRTARAWAEAHSWDQLGPLWLAELELAAA